MQGARRFSLGFAWRRCLSQTRVPDMAAFGVDHLPQHRQARVPVTCAAQATSSGGPGQLHDHFHLDILVSFLRACLAFLGMLL